MKKLLFDGMATQGTGGISYHGGAEYAKFMLREMANRGRKFDVVLDPERFTDPEIDRFLNTEFKGNILNISSRKELYETIDREGYDVFYTALPYEFVDYSAKATFVAVIHGLRAVELPWDYYRYRFYHGPVKRPAALAISHSKMLRKMLFKRALKRHGQLLNFPGAKFVTVSNHSKCSVLNFYPDVNPDNVAVFYAPFTVKERRETIPGDYFLMVSANRYEKNIYRAIKAFDRLFSQGRLEGKRVVITGCTDSSMVNYVRNRDRFTLLPYVDAVELERLYREAFCFVYPSLNEGFGYPPLTSMNYGVPVIASSATSIPEACDDAALYFCPTSVDELCNRLIRIDVDKQLRNTLIERGYRRVDCLQKMQRDNMEKQIAYIFD